MKTPIQVKCPICGNIMKKNPIAGGLPIKLSKNVNGKIKTGFGHTDVVYYYCPLCHNVQTFWKFQVIKGKKPRK